MAHFTFQASGSRLSKAGARLDPRQGQSVIHHMRNQNIFLGAGSRCLFKASKTGSEDVGSERA